MAAQLPEAEKIKAADFVIDNSGLLVQTREQVRQRLHTEVGDSRP
jgi:dephospho-CoA kinase